MIRTFTNQNVVKVKGGLLQNANDVALRIFTCRSVFERLKILIYLINKPECVTIVDRREKICIMRYFKNRKLERNQNPEVRDMCINGL